MEGTMMIDMRNEQWFPVVSEVLNALKSTNQYEQVLHLVVDRIVRISKCQTCAIVLVDQKTEYLRIDNCYGLSLTFCNAYRHRIATAAIGELLWTGKPIVIPDSDEQPLKSGEVQLEHSFGSCLCVQIAVDHRTLGYIHLDSREKNAFTDSDALMLQPFADLVGLAIFKSDLYEENLKLHRLDSETGLEKYGPFLEKLNASMKRAQDFNERFAVLILDIDHFKDTENTYGYDASRELLKEMGDLIKSHIRNIDAAGRYGFDEFIIMMANAGLDAAVILARTLLNAVEERTFTKHRIKSTMSIGLAAYPQNGRNTEDIVLTAKKALFEARRAGRNNVFCYPSEWFAGDPISSLQ